jgi:hypothetical protein
LHRIAHERVDAVSDGMWRIVSGVGTGAQILTPPSFDLGSRPDRAGSRVAVFHERG